MEGYTTTVHRSVAELKQGEWNAIVAQQSKAGSVFERYEWLAAYEAASDARPGYVEVRKHGTLVGVHPTFTRPVGGTPFSFLGPAQPGYNGPLVATDEAEVLGAMLDAIENRCGGRTIGHMFKPAAGRSLRYANALRDRGYVPTVRGCQFRVALDRPWEAIAAGLHHDKRRNLNRADDAGVVVEQVHPTAEAIAEFAAMHERQMARIGGEGTTHAFLDALRERLADRITLFVARVDGENAGELLTVSDDERDRLYLLFPGYDPDGFEFYASEALYRAAMQWGIEQGYSECNFGETEPDWTDGTFAYKSKFGAEVVPSLRWERIHSRLLRIPYFLAGGSTVGPGFGGRIREFLRR
jgi:predicted N-acyltransferase